jgi:sterol desaturase/sphingolipid hydroxylase (fatty acid hydroxylase superfamily)
MGGPFVQACQAALVLLISHGLCVLIIMYYDLSGRWSEYSINKHRSVTLYDYWVGWRSFCVDLVLMFVPFMTACFTYSAKRINDSQDDVMTAATKLVGGYVLGKLWAFVVHYALHFPWLYHFHRKHHLNPRKIVASAAWQDSFVEYAVMELPSLPISPCFCFTFAGMVGTEPVGIRGFRHRGFWDYCLMESIITIITVI